jgi:epoxide hydrolase-like predicted phosphatase
MQNIQTLIFDLGGVIINLKTEQEWLEEDLLPNFQPERLQLLQQQQYFQLFETGNVSVPDFKQQLKEIAVNKNITEEEVVHHWNGILKDIPKHRVDVLKQLSKKYKLILLSNTNHIHMDFIRNYMVAEFGEDILQENFHTCYYSQEIGLRKPHKEIYEFVLQQQGITASESLFLDDKPENLSEPEKLGIHTFLVDFNALTAASLQHLT